MLSQFFKLFSAQKRRKESTQKESGRSMIEMLAVLGVIGVLSVAAVAGYRYSIDKSRANELVHQLTTEALFVSQQVEKGVNPRTTANTTKGGFPLDVFDEISGITPAGDNVFYLVVFDVPRGVCKNVVAMGYDIPINIYVTGTVTEGNPEICGENNRMEFEFSVPLDADAITGNGDGTECPPCDPTEICVNGVCVDNPTLCSPPCASTETCVDNVCVPASCVSNVDCPGEVCDTVTGECVECLVNTDCQEQCSICDPVSKTCTNPDTTPRSLVKKMTSNSTPAPYHVVSNNEQSSTYAAWFAFDGARGATDRAWATSVGFYNSGTGMPSGAAAYIGYVLPTDHMITHVSARFYYLASLPKEMEILVGPSSNIAEATRVWHGNNLSFPDETDFGMAVTPMLGKAVFLRILQNRGWSTINVREIDIDGYECPQE